MPTDFDDSHMTDDPQPEGTVYDEYVGRRVPVDAATAGDLLRTLTEDRKVISEVGNYRNDDERRNDVEVKAHRFYAQFRKVDPGEPVCAYMNRLVELHTKTGARKDMVDGHFAAVCGALEGHTGLAATIDALASVRDGAKGHARDVRRSIEGAYKEAMKRRVELADTCSCPGMFDVIRPARPIVLPDENDEQDEDEGEGPDDLDMDVTAYLDGEVEPTPTERGLRRRDDTLPLLYAGLTHMVVGESEAGKSWLALACAAAELLAGRRVTYVHFEEPDARITILHLRQMGVSRHLLTPGGPFRFAAPEQQLTHDRVDRLTAHRADLVVIDGVNAAMNLHGLNPSDATDYGVWDRKLARPMGSAGAAVLSLDHPVKNAEQKGNGYAGGTVMKLNLISGASFLLENREPLAPGKCGQSSLYVAKDRPGSLRAVAVNKGGRRALLGTLWVDSTKALTEVRLTSPVAVDEVEDDRPVDAKALKVLATVVRLHAGPNRQYTPSTTEVRAKAGVQKADVLGHLETLEAHGLVGREKGEGTTRWIPLNPAAEKALQPAGTIHPDDF